MLNQISKYLNVKLALVILLFNLTSHIGTSQGLKFQLKDEEDGSGLNAAKIIVFQDGNTVLSDNSGYFELPTNYLGQEIKISHASYNTKRMILRIDSDTVQVMTRKYRSLGTIYLERHANQSSNGWPIIKGAKYKTGWGPFVYNLQVALKEKSVILDSLKEVKFEVSSSGEMALSQPASDPFEIALSQVFEGLNKWEPGESNGTKVRQFFQLKFLDEEPEFEQIFTIVEDKPYPEGGMDGLVKKHLSRIVYPQEALDLGIEGQVFVQFIINEDGSLSDVKAIKGIGHGCDEEAIRVIKESSPWTPGRQRGKPVKVRMIIPITFKDSQRSKKSTNPVEGFYQFMVREVGYPLEARKKQIQGRVWISFEYSEEENKIKNIKQHDSLGGLLAQEVERAFKNCPIEKIKPLLDGSGAYQLPTYFKLGDSKYSGKRFIPLENAIILNELLINAVGVNNVPGVSITNTKIHKSIKSASKDEQLTKLILPQRNISEIPDEIGKLKKLETLELHNNRISVISPQIGQLQELKRMVLMHNEITKLPTEFADLQKLEVLGFAYNKLGVISPEILALTKLKGLDLAGNNIQEFASGINKLNNLELLILSDNPIKEVPPTLFELKKLKQLYLLNTQIPKEEQLKIKEKLPKTTVVFTDADIPR